MASDEFVWRWRPGHPPPGISPTRSHEPLFDALTATAHELQKLLTDEILTSVDLVEEYVWRIEENNPYLHAISQYSASALAQAQEMDARRAAGKVLSPLHGIPLVIKNTISTGPGIGLEATAGAPAMAGSRAPKNAGAIDRLVRAGAIILASTTISEWSYNKGENLYGAWSALDGQGQSAYVRGGLDKDDTYLGHSVPGGSSSGLSIAISAGLAPLGVGEDTTASLSAPAVRAALYAMRPTLGLIPTDGLIPVAHSFDTIGPMSKDVEDLANLFTVLTDQTSGSNPSDKYVKAVARDWSEVRIGMVDPHLWTYPPEVVKPVGNTVEQLLEKTQEAFAKIKDLAAVAHQNVDLRPANDFKLDGVHAVNKIMDAEFMGDVDAYLSTLDTSKVRTLKEIITWNKQNADIALPKRFHSQSKLIAALNGQLSQAEYDKYTTHYKQIASSVNDVFKKYGVDIIVAPGDSSFPNFAAANGFPNTALPIGTLDYNGRPIGLMALAGANKEELLFNFLGAFEASFPPREIPTAFEDEVAKMKSASSS